MIRPTFLGFETAKRALNISQAGLDTVGHNISNAQTAGYTRQRIDQVAMSMNGTATKYQVFGAASNGMGSNLQGINQVRDVYLDNRYRAEASVNGELGVKADGLTDINNIFDEIMTDGIHSKMGDLLRMIDLLSQSPDSKELCMTVRDTANQLAQILNKNASQLEQARSEQVLDLKTGVDQDVNNIIKKIADLNQKIKNDNFYGNPSNDLNDQRNLLIDQLSEYVDIKVVRTPQKVTDTLTVSVVSIEINNSGNPPLKLVDGSNYNQIGVEEDPANGNVIVSLMDGISGMQIQDLTKSLTKGGLKGYIDIINGTGANIDDGFEFRGIPYYQKALDEFAVQLAEVMNRVNNITEQESLDSAKSYAPVIKGDVAAWMNDITSGTVDFSGKNTNMIFEYNGTNLTAKYTDENGTEQTYGPVPYVSGDQIDFALPATKYKGSATDWIDSVTSGSVVFENKNTDISFDYDSTTGEITATILDANGDPQTYKATSYTPGDTPIDFYESDGTTLAFSVTPNPTTPPAAPPDGNAGSLSVGNIAFSIVTDSTVVPNAPTPPETKVTMGATIDAGWPAIPSTNGNKNLIVPVTPTVTDSTGAKPAWIDTISGKEIQFSGKDYDIKFDYNTAGFDTGSGTVDPTKTMRATMTDENGNIVEYYGTYSSNGKVDFRDANGAVMFSVKTTTVPPSATSDVNVDATINAKNIAVSQNWFDDPLYITTTKQNPSDIKKATLALTGTNKPTWLNKVSTGDDGINVTNGTYQFKFGGDPRKVSVVINGITYEGEYKSSSTIELKGGVPEKVGLVIETTAKDPGRTDPENVASIAASTGAKGDNVLKFMTELKASNHYGVSGIAGNFQEFLQSFHAQMGLDKNLNSSLLDASLSVISGYADRRDAISAVSIDEEGVNMMTFQNYYNAAARYMTTLDEALDKIINGMGTVGR